jgi:2-acylglycerol O-acyltransferase 2
MHAILLILGYHPHGIISVGVFVNFGTEANRVSEVLKGIKVHGLTLNSQFNMPFWREYLLSMGFCSVSRKSCDYILSQKEKGTAILLVPGGAREALDAHPGTCDLTLGKRKGFIKVALANGADLVPVLGFGENDLFYQVNNKEGTSVRKWQQWFLKKFGITPCLPYARGIFQYDYGMVPNRQKLVTVVGKAIKVEKISNPSDEIVEEYHKKYIQGIKAIYEKYHAEYAPTWPKEFQIVL